MSDNKKVMRTNTDKETSNTSINSVSAIFSPIINEKKNIESKKNE